MSKELNILPLNNWLDVDKHPLVISGPCSAESEQQLLSTAKALAKTPHVKVFRAGIWKPRTHPKSFEGVGSIGLTWLKQVKQETGLLTTVEVANPKHIEECLDNEVDILWIGARTSVNPFSVEEISQALKGVDIPVMVKNPINPDIELWIGTLERINQAGINKLIAVHRGFSSFEKTSYRNAPLWEIPIELKRLHPQLPIICDPSHICGNTNMLLEVSQKALDLEMNGLMIESHIEPEVALTDAKQQVTPVQLSNLISNLIIRKSSGNKEFENELEKLRAEIDIIDRKLLHILTERMNIVEKIGEYKREHNITILQIKRWNEILRDRSIIADKLDLNKDFLLEILRFVHQESIQRQVDIMNKEDKSG